MNRYLLKTYVSDAMYIYVINWLGQTTTGKIQGVHCRKLGRRRGQRTEGKRRRI